MPTRQKTSRSGKLVSSIKPEAVFQELDSKLADINGKLELLERKYTQKPSVQLSNLIKQYQEQGVGIEQEMATMLRGDPALAQIERANSLQGKPGYSLEKDYREQLSQEQDKLEAQLISELRAEQDKREQEWRKAERAKIDQREQRLLEMLAERQAKVEDEWQLRRKTDSAVTAFAWFSEQQKVLREQLQAGMQKLRQDFDLREQDHAEEMRRELTQLERNWSEKRRRELQKLEVDWREQEIMHRERIYLRRMEGEWRAEQRSTLEQLTAIWRAEFEQAQIQQLAAHIGEVLPKLSKQWTEQLIEEQDAQSRSLFKQTKAEWDALLHDTLRKELEQTTSSIRKEVAQRLNSEITSSITSLTALSSENLKTTQRDYAALAAAWEKKHAEALQSQKELWQNQQKKSLIELSAEMKGSVQGQFLQLKTVLESQMTQVITNMFKQWSLQFTEEQAGKSQATFKQLKSEWDLILKEALRREAEALQSRASEGARILQSQNEQSITSAQSKLEQQLTATFSDSLKALQREYATLVNKWETKYTEVLQEQQKLWQSEQSRLMKDMSASVWHSLQGQMSKYEEATSQAHFTALREMSIKLSEQIAIEIAQRIDTLRQVFHRDFEQYARGWQGELDLQFAQLSHKYTLQHQQELELLGQETRGDLVKETDIAREQLKLTYANELQGVAKEVELIFAAKLEQQKQAMLHEHHKQLETLETHWKNSTEAAIGDLLTTMAASHEQQLDKLKITFGQEYRRELQAVALADGKEREKYYQVLAEKAAGTLEEYLSAALKDFEGIHAERLNELRAELNAQNTRDISRSLKSWQEMAKQSIAEQVTELISSFEAQAAKSAQNIEEKCYLEYRGRLGKMVDELVRRQKEGPQENAPNPPQTSTNPEHTIIKPREQAKQRRPSR